MINIAPSGELPVWIEAEPVTEIKSLRGILRQEGGSHYELNIQPIEYIHGNELGFIEGNIIKYATRHRAKNGAEDIRKIIHYCELLLELEYGESQEEELRESDSAEHREGDSTAKPQFFPAGYGSYSESNN
tara:strand:+ start:204 stop:596 length:393 start_codon:yes stop_codon:yes gene_type:complete